MTEINQLYKCEICGNIVEVVHSGVGQLVCCGQPMQPLTAKTEDQGYEKHLPVVEKTEKGIKVKVGSIPHPMDEQHYIELIEVITDTGVLRKFLKPGEPPEAEFCVDKIHEVREHCTLHGLWSTHE
jgi:superoxide reductase